MASTRISTPYVLKGIEHSYHLLNDRDKIEKQPIRRLQTEGTDVLKVDELLGIALGQGGALESKIREYGSGFLTTFNSVSDITESLGIDHLQASRLLAILELGKRLYSKSEGALVQIRGIEDVYQYYRSMNRLAKEHLKVGLINSRYQLIHEETLAIGSTEYLHVSPRDVFQPAVERRVTAIILVHNHPSGNPEPSEADLAFTKTVVEAGNLLGIEVLDHVIIGSDGYTTCLNSQS